MSRTRLAAVALLALLVLTACNTVQGIGRDVRSAGDAIEDAGD
jgi:predicted small secreted protein